MSKTKLLAAALLTATLAIGIGRQSLPTADAQTPSPTPGALGGSSDGSGPPGPGGEGSPPVKGAATRPPAGGSGAGPAGMMGGSASRGPRVEYHFVARPKGADAFKKLLTQQGADGWEYVGVVPGDDELIFKRPTRPGGVMSGGMGGPGGMPGGLGGFGGAPGGGGFGGFSGGPGAGGFGSGFGGGPGLGGFGSTLGGSSGTPAPKGGPGGRGAPGGEGTPGDGAANPFGGGPGAAATSLTVREGETIRHKMKTNQTIDRAHSDNPKAVEVTLDPTDARRVLIRALAGSGARIELTDEKGTKERYTVRVR